MTFHRTALAQEMAQQLLNPSFLDKSLRSGLFLSGQRRVGKTTFLATDLIPALEKEGAIVIYVDLWSQPQMDPAGLVYEAIKASLNELQSPGSGLLEKLKRVSSLNVGAAGFKFGFQLSNVGKEGGTSLAQAFTELVDQTRTDVVLIIDEVQHALGSVEGDAMLHALKAARDAINTRNQTPGYFLFVGTGSHRARVQELAVKGNQAFNGALTREFPVLEQDFVEYILKQVQPVLGAKTPSLSVATEAFKLLGNRPEELMKALNVVRQLSPDAVVDEHFPTIAQSLGAAAADVEIQKIETFGPLAEAVFSRICKIGGNVRGSFTAPTLKDFSTELGREVTAGDVQGVLTLLTGANLLMRANHGEYCVTDSFVEKSWIARLKADNILSLESPANKLQRT